jgi:hypothetical protein
MMKMILLLIMECMGKDMKRRKRIKNIASVVV